MFYVMSIINISTKTARRRRAYKMGKGIVKSGVLKRMVAGGVIMGMAVGMMHTSAPAEAKRAKATLNKKSVTLEVGGSVKLKVKNVKKAKTTWKTTNKKVARVNKKGKVTAMSEGNANIKAIVKAGKKRYKLTCKVSVKAKAQVNPQVTQAAPASKSTVSQTPANTATATPDVTPVTDPTMPPVTATPEPTVPPVPLDKMPSEKDSSYYDSTLSYMPYANMYKKADENNVLLPNTYACDPYAMEYDGRVYVYMSNDSEQYEATDKNGLNVYGYMRSVHIISSDDMVNWTDHGIYQIAGSSGVCSWAGCCWAPCATHKTVDGKEKFYMYFTNGGWQIGVVESDTPYGPWRDIRGKALLGGMSDYETTSSALDPAVFIDDDGSAWLTYGAGNYDKDTGKGGARLRKLSDNMMDFEGDEITVEAPYYNEDSGFNKIGDTYYFSYCGDWSSGSDHSMCAILYMTSKDITGPYTYGGEILPNCGSVFKYRNGADASGNNHHSIVNFKGKYYMFYHTMNLQDLVYCKNNFATGGDNPYYLGYRSTACNEVNLKDDGSFEIVNQDTKGVNQIKDFNPYQETAGTVYNNASGMEAAHMEYYKIPTSDKDTIRAYVNDGRYIETTYNKTDYKNLPTYLFNDSKNPIYRGYIRMEDGARMEAIENKSKYYYSWSMLKGVDFGTDGPKSFTANFEFDKEVSDHAKIRVVADDLRGTVICEGEIVASEDGSATITLDTANITGKHDIYFEFDGSVYNFKNWKFSK